MIDIIKTKIKVHSPPKVLAMTMSFLSSVKYFCIIKVLAILLKKDKKKVDGGNAFYSVGFVCNRLLCN